MTSPAKIDRALNVLNFNPWPHAQRPGAVRPDPERAPISWYLLSAATAAAIAGAADEVLLAYPAKVSPAERSWLEHRVHERLMERREAGDPGARAAIDALDRSGEHTMLLREVVAKRLEGGSLLQTLDQDIAAMARHRERVADMMAGPR